MRALIDTNIIIHREASKAYHSEIGILFNWFDRLKIEKCVHPLSIEEIENYKDESVVETMKIKIKNYNLLKTVSKDDKIIEALRLKDKTRNDFIDTSILMEIYFSRLDILISEDKGLHRKARELGISDKVFRIDDFIEKSISENPELKGYEVLSVHQEFFGNLDLSDSFFDSFREDYSEFEKWFLKKSDETSYVCLVDGKVSAFLYLKIETETDSYSDIKPPFDKKRRLKIGTLKVTSTGYKLGERFLKVVFDNALIYDAEEIYVTIFERTDEQLRLIDLLQEWGFVHWGTKKSKNGIEKVMVREFGKKLPCNIQNPKLTFPFLSRETRKFIVKIHPDYHTELFPDSINTKENKTKYVDNQPHRNRIEKVYISHSKDRDLKPGDVIIVYRMGEVSPKRFSSTVTSICIVQEVINNIGSFEQFYTICQRKTFFTRNDLELNWWNKFSDLKPFVIKLLYAHSLPTPKPTLNDLEKLGVIPDIKNMPRGFVELNNEQFNSLVKFAYKKKSL